MITISTALKSLRPDAQWVLNNNSYSELTWLDQVQSKPTYDEVQDEITRLTLEEPFTACKEEAKKRIALTDWAVLPDVGLANVAEFETYRASLRALIKNPVAEPVFGTEPQPVWL